MTHGVHPHTGGNARTTRRILSVLIAVVVSAVALTPWRGGAQPGDERLAHMRIRGCVSPTGGFVGHLTIVALTIGDVG
jgi:hypothetical protein